MSITMGVALGGAIVGNTVVPFYGAIIGYFANKNLKILKEEVSSGRNKT